ncbi:hypothetical protein EXIGLDRAFT_752837, partial [Exidia glandulosa HHB12029]
MEYHVPSAGQLTAQIRRAAAQQSDLVEKRTKLRRSIAKLELEHQQLLAEDRSLQLQMATLDRELDAMRRKLSPIRAFPQDVLVHIFLLSFYSSVNEFACNVGGTKTSPSSLDPARDFIFTVAAVCREWRAVALNAANLWTAISLGLGDFVMLDDGDEDPAEWRTRTSAWIAHVDTCLARSRTAPLYIYLYELTAHDAPNIMDPEFTAYRSIMSKLLGAAGRWKVFYARIRHCLGGSSYVPLNFQAATPLLERFMLWEDTYFPDERPNFADPPIPARFLSHAPRVHALHIPNSLLRWGAFPSTCFPSLRSLTIGGGGVMYRADWDTGCALLEACPALETLVLNDMFLPDGHAEGEAFVPPSNAAGRDVVVMEHLGTLELHWMEYGLLQWWPVRLAFPALTRLVLGDYCNTEAVHNVLAGLVRSSTHGSRVRILKATYNGDQGDDGTGLGRLLGHFDHLDTVELGNFDLHSRDISQFLGIGDSGLRWVLCPELRRLCFRDCQFADESASRAIVDVVEKRALHGPRDSRRHENGYRGPPLLEDVSLRQIHTGSVDTLTSNIPLWLPETIQRMLQGDIYQ